VADEETLKVLERQFDDLIPHILDYNYTVPEEMRNEVTDRIRQHYFHGQPISKSIKQIIQVYKGNSTHFYCAEFHINLTNLIKLISNCYLTNMEQSS
jgi:hypothetical protein